LTATRSLATNVVLLGVLLCGVLLVRAAVVLLVGHGFVPWLGVCLALELLDFALLLATPVLALLVLAGVVVLVLPAATRTWRVAALLVMVPALWFVAGFLTMPLEARLHREELERAIAHGDSLVRAIRHCESRTGVAPDDLAALVPRDIKAIPGTGLSGFPDFQYHRPQPGQWVLLTGVFVRGSSYARLEYRSSGQYDHRYERIGAWGLEVNQ
jgi:hypothetical protein